MIQTIINVLYRHPIAKFKRISKLGGYFSYNHMMHNRKLMEKAALHLSPVNSYTDGLPVYFLTGKNYLYQTLFCIRSLVKASPSKFKFTLIDDGTFNDKLINQVNILLPGAIIVTQLQIEENLDKYLPPDLYPHLRQKRKVYPHIKKLTDVHTIPGNNWKIVLDSDMLFWDHPQEVTAWLQNPRQPIHMLDCVESYGYSKKLMTELCGSPIPELLNVGIIGLNSNDINWQKLDSWVEALEAQEGTSYYLEQALTAMLIGNKEAIVLNKDTYKVNPTDNDKKTVVLQHYVDVSKKIYFTTAWKKIIN
jgi:hypothetical protein